ncbi:trichohyalin-like [Pristis pectinata]|uniref:trichohyalin-like n=1 Tax=Pristis pectinata TaxID=685728 RepID=UPI00223CBAF9|nr:trichohyalin-like [Pristis pectinata]
MACFRRKARRTKTSALGIVRGTVPEKLREVHKDISVGSLLMAPDGEIVRLSLLDSVQGPSGSFPGCSSHPKGSKPLVYGFDGKKDRSITKQRMEGGSQTDSAARSSCQEEDIWSSSDDDDILCEIDGDSSQSQTPTQLTSEQRRARKALRQGRKRQTQLDGTSSGGPVSDSARGAKVNSDRRAKRRAKVNSDRRAKGEAMVNSDTRAKGEAKVNSDRRAKGEEMVNSDRRARGEATVNSDRRAKGEATVRRRQRQAPDDIEEMTLGEDGNLHRSYPPGRTRHGTEYDSVHERERAQGTRQTTHASTYRRSAAGSSLAGWSQSEHGILDAAEELGSPSSHREVENGCLPKASRRRKLQKDGFVAEDDSETDVEDWEAEPWRELIEGRTRIKAKKHKSKRKGRRSPNQDPSIGDGDWVPSSGEESTGSILVPGENSPSEQEGTRQSHRRLAANDLSELGRALRPNRAPGGNKERNKSNGRAEFVVGRPREKRAQHQYLPPGKQQKEVSQQRRKAMREDEMEEDIITQMGSETRGLHSPSSGSTPTAGLASAAGPGPTSSYTDVRARGSGKDGARSRGQLEESREWPKGATSASESKRPRQLDSKRLEVGQWPDDESEDEDKQLDPSERRRQAVERQIQRELDEERRRREETRFKRQQQDHGAPEQEDDEQQQQKGEQRDRERRQKQQEDYRRKFQEMQQAKERILAERANEKARLERLHQEQREEERRLLSEMDEPQRQEYLRLKQIREEQMRQQLEERRQKEGERNRLLLEAARREAVSFLRQKGLMGQGLMLHGGLLLELMELEQGQNVTRPWVFSYFELMEILALETSVETE